MRFFSSFNMAMIRSIFIVIVTLRILSAFMFSRGDPRGPFLTWGTVGVISVFSILAAFSVGFSISRLL
jgi:hypothetical protein